MTEKLLERMAAEMRAILKGTSARWVHRRLARGLELVLSHTEEHWRLALARADVWPADEEIAICRAAFGLPEPLSENQKVMTQPSGRQLYVIELSWLEYPEVVHE